MQSQGSRIIAPPIPPPTRPGAGGKAAAAGFGSNPSANPNSNKLLGASLRNNLLVADDQRMMKTATNMSF